MAHAWKAFTRPSPAPLRARSARQATSAACLIPEPAPTPASAVSRTASRTTARTAACARSTVSRPLAAPLSRTARASVVTKAWPAQADASRASLEGTRTGPEKETACCALSASTAVPPPRRPRALVCIARRTAPSCSRLRTRRSRSVYAWQGTVQLYRKVPSLRPRILQARRKLRVCRMPSQCLLSQQ